MHIVMLASTHPPTDARIFAKEAATLVEAGHRVTIATMANGEFESAPGIDFVIIPRPKNRFARVIKSRKLYKIALDLDAEIYIIHDPEMLFVGRMLARAGKKFLYDAHEPYPFFLAEKRWVPRPLSPLVRILAEIEEMRGARASSGIIVAMSENEERLASAGKAILTLHNFPRLEHIVEGVGERESVVIYIGGVMEPRFGVEMLSMAKDFAPGGILDGWRLEILGPVHYPKYRKRCIAAAMPHEGKNYLNFTGEYIKYDLAFERVRRARIGLSLVRPTPNYSRIISTKVFDYMASGTVPIATRLPSYEGIISDRDGPIFVEPGEEARVPEIIADMAKDESAVRQRAERCIRSVRERFNWEVEGRGLPGFLGRIVDS